MQCAAWVAIKSSRYDPLVVPAVAKTATELLVDFAAAGFTGGTTPTMGISNCCRSSLKATVAAVLPKNERFLFHHPPILVYVAIPSPIQFPWAYCFLVSVTSFALPVPIPF